MPSYNKQPIAERLAFARLALSNALESEELAGPLADYGYNQARINNGLALWDTANNRQFARETAVGDQLGAADTCKAQWAAAQIAYMRQLKIARVALQDAPGAARNLALHEARKKDMPGWLAQARQFYSGLAATPEFAARIAEYGITEARLAPVRAALDALEAANYAHEQARGAAQAALAARDEALAALDAWMSDFLKVARVAMAERPQILEQLGVRVPS